MSTPHSAAAGAPGAPEATRPGMSASVRARAIGLVALMAIGSVVMWLGIPALLLWLASKMQHGSNPSFGPYLMVLFGLIVLMTAMGMLLGALDRAYIRVTRTEDEGPIPRPAWLKSVRGERGSTQRQTILGTVMAISVMVALAASAIWFTFFAHYDMGF